MNEQHFTVVAGVSFNYFINILVILSSGSQPRGEAPSKGNKITERLCDDKWDA